MKYFPRTWIPSTAYSANEAVLYSGLVYYCLTTHTSTSTFDSTKFRLITEADNYTSPVRTQVYNDRFIAVDLVELHIKNLSGVLEPLYLCNSAVNISYKSPTSHNSGTQVYAAQGEFMGFSNVPEEFDVKVGKFSVYLSAIGNNYINLFKDTDIEGKRVVIYKAFLDYNTLGVLDTPVMLFDGTIHNVAITESSRTASLTVDCSTLFADFERINGRRTTKGSNTLYQGSDYDQCMDKAGINGNTEIKWGRVN
jgi:hypothetical protein